MTHRICCELEVKLCSCRISKFSIHLRAAATHFNKHTPLYALAFTLRKTLLSSAEHTNGQRQFSIEGETGSPLESKLTIATVLHTVASYTFFKKHISSLRGVSVWYQIYFECGISAHMSDRFLLMPQGELSESTPEPWEFRLWFFSSNWRVFVEIDARIRYSSNKCFNNQHSLSGRHTANN